MSDFRRFIAQNKVDAKRVSVSIPLEWSLVKFMDIPSAGEDAVNQLLHYELERHIPFSLDDVYHASRIVEKGSDRCSVATVVVQREVIEKVNEFLKKTLSSACDNHCFSFFCPEQHRIKRIYHKYLRGEAFGEQLKK